MYAFIAERVAGNGLNGIDKSSPLWFISPPRECVRSRTGIKCSKLIVLVDVRLAHAEQPFKYTSQCAGSVRACRAVEIHRLPVCHRIDHAAKIELPRCNRSKCVGCRFVGNRKPHIAPKWGFCCNVPVGWIAALFASEIDFMLHTKFPYKHRSICGGDTPASNQQPVFHGSTVAGPSSQIAHIPRFCGVIPRANPPQRIQRFQRSCRVRSGKRRQHVRHFVVVHHPARLLPDGLVVAYHRFGWRIICDLRCAVISRIVHHICEVAPNKLRALVPFYRFHIVCLYCFPFHRQGFSVYSYYFFHFSSLQKQNAKLTPRLLEALDAPAWPFALTLQNIPPLADDRSHQNSSTPSLFLIFGFPAL